MSEDLELFGRPGWVEFAAGPKGSVSFQTHAGLLLRLVRLVFALPRYLVTGKVVL